MSECFFDPDLPQCDFDNPVEIYDPRREPGMDEVYYFKQAKFMF